MNKIELEIDGRKVESTYKPIFRRLVEVELITPYKGLKVEFVTADEEGNVFIETQAEELVTESLRLLMKQIQNVIKYRSIYQRLNDEFSRIADLMWSVLRETECSDQRLRFSYHLALESRMCREFERELQQQIPELTEENKQEFFTRLSLLNKILSRI